MPSPTVTTARSVMRFLDAEDGVVQFSNREEPAEESAEDTELFLPWDRWHAMGEPLTLTVTIRPGDLLNGRERDD